MAHAKITRRILARQNVDKKSLSNSLLLLKFVCQSNKNAFRAGALSTGMMHISIFSNRSIPAKVGLVPYLGSNELHPEPIPLKIPRFLLRCIGRDFNEQVISLMTNLVVFHDSLKRSYKTEDLVIGDSH